MSDLNTFLQNRRPAPHPSVPTKIPPAPSRRSPPQVKNATVDVWTGNNDYDAAQAGPNLNVPVSGQIST